MLFLRRTTEDVSAQGMSFWIDPAVTFQPMSQRDTVRCMLVPNSLGTLSPQSIWIILQYDVYKHLIWLLLCRFVVDVRHEFWSICLVSWRPLLVSHLICCDTKFSRCFIWLGQESDSNFISIVFISRYHDFGDHVMRNYSRQCIHYWLNNVLLKLLTFNGFPWTIFVFSWHLFYIPNIWR